MSVKELPKVFVHICDVCGFEDNRGSSVSPSRWSKFILERHAYDYQGNACADATIKRLLCSKCSTEFNKLVNKWSELKMLSKEK